MSSVTLVCFTDDPNGPGYIHREVTNATGGKFDLEYSYYEVFSASKTRHHYLTFPWDWVQNFKKALIQDNTI